jgi:hypothetical protein
MEDCFRTSIEDSCAALFASESLYDESINSCTWDDVVHPAESKSIPDKATVYVYLTGISLERFIFTEPRYGPALFPSNLFSKLQGMNGGGIRKEPAPSRSWL